MWLGMHKKSHKSMDWLDHYHLVCVFGFVFRVSGSSCFLPGKDKGTRTMGEPRCIICLDDKLWIAFLIGDHGLYLSMTPPTLLHRHIPPPE